MAKVSNKKCNGLLLIGRCPRDFRADDITDMALTPLGVMVGTGEGIYRLTGHDTGALISRTPVEALWWDDTDALYCLTAERDLIAVIGLLDRYREITTAGK